MGRWYCKCQWGVGHRFYKKGHPNGCPFLVYTRAVNPPLRSWADATANVCGRLVIATFYEKEL